MLLYLLCLHLSPNPGRSFNMISARPGFPKHLSRGNHLSFLWISIAHDLYLSYSFNKNVRTYYVLAIILRAKKTLKKKNWIASCLCSSRTLFITVRIYTCSIFLEGESYMSDFSWSFILLSQGSAHSTHEVIFGWVICTSKCWLVPTGRGFRKDNWRGNAGCWGKCFLKEHGSFRKMDYSK